MGDEGSTVLQNAAQIGALPALLTVSGGAIPASGAVNVTASNMPSNSNLNAFSGTLKGVHGLLAWNADVSSLQFTRTQDGEAVSVAEGEPLIPDAIGYRDKVIILESGKNDINGGVTADALLNNTIVVASWFAPYLPQTIVMGHFANGNYNSSRRNVLAAVNAGVVATFGNRAIDQQAWFTSDKLWDDLAAEGIVPTSADLADQAAGDVPQSLMTSARDHLTTAAYGYRAKYLVRPKLIEIMQYSEAQ